MKFGITGSKLRKKLLSSLAILSLAFTGLVALSTPASAAGQETITFDSSQYVTDNGAAGFFKVIAESNGVSGYGHADWAPWATGDAKNADPILVDWMTAGVPWNKGWKVKTDVGNANNVLYIQKPESSELNSGITLLDRTDNQTIISTGNLVVTAKVKALADASVTVTMKLTDTNGGAITQSATTSGTANTWSTLTFDFTTPASGTFDSSLAYKKLDLMFDPANAKAGQGHEDWGNNPVTSATTSKLYFLDDVSYTLAAAPGGGGSPTVPVAHRLVAAGSTGLIGTPFDKGAQGWFQYYSAGVKYYTALAEVGTAVTLKWHVTNTSGAAFANQAVNLIVGKSYAGSTASFSTTYSGHESFNTTGSGGSDARTISGTTDANGDVSWTLTNTDLVGQTRPANLNGTVPDGGVFAQIALLLPGGNQSAEDQDIINLHFVAPAEGGGGGTDSTHYNIRLTSPVMAENSFDASARMYRGDFAGLGEQAIANGASARAYVYYAPIGSTITLTYHVDNGAIGVTGDPVVGKTIRLIVGKNFSDSKASFTTAAANPGGYPIGSNEVVLTGVTNESGNVTFTLVNTNTSGSVAPASATSDPDTISADTWVKSNFYPTTGTGSSDAAAQNESIDNLWPYFYTPADYVAPPVVMVKTKMISTPTLSYDLGAKTLTCSNLTADGRISDAAYFLFINNKLIGGKVAGTTKGLNYGYDGVTLSTSGATLESATWAIAASWNTNNIARARCIVKSFVTGAETIVAATSTVSIPRIGKYMPRAKKGATVATTAVTMRLVEPALVKDAAGKASNYFDWSYNALENDWAKYYGPKLAFIYKYINAGSTTTFKWHVTDTNTGAALTSFPVSLIINKNYGGVQNATFTYEMNGATKEIAASPSNSGTGETKIAGMTDENGNVSFTITNTNSVASAEPTPAALNEMQPASAVNLHSQITLTAGLDQTKESIDLLEIHIVKP